MPKSVSNSLFSKVLFPDPLLPALPTITRPANSTSGKKEGEHFEGNVSE